MDLPFDPVIPLLEIHPKNLETVIQKTLRPHVHSNTTDNGQVLEIDRKTAVNVHNGILHSRKKEEGIPTFCDSMDGTGDYYTK